MGVHSGGGFEPSLVRSSFADVQIRQSFHKAMLYFYFRSLEENVTEKAFRAGGEVVSS